MMSKRPSSAPRLVSTSTAVSRSRAAIVIIYAPSMLYERQAPWSKPWRWACCVKESDRKSTRLNSSHSQISYAVFCLKKLRGRGEKKRIGDDEPARQLPDQQSAENGKHAREIETRRANPPAQARSPSPLHGPSLDAAHPGLSGS